MTVSNIQRRYTYLADGVTRDWPIEFSYHNSSDIKVYHITADGVETEITDITVVANNVTAPATGEPFASGESIRIERALPYTQLDDYTTQGAFTPEDMERTADRLIMITQQIRDVAEDTEDYVNENLSIIGEWRDDAETAAGLAEAAQAAAESARDIAVPAKNDAEAAKDDAESAQGLAEAAQAAAEAARDIAVPAKNDAEAAKDDAESAQGLAEAAQAAAEGARDRAVVAEENAVWPLRRGYYSSVATYARGDIVSDVDGDVWLCTADNTIGSTPAHESGPWVPFTIVQNTYKEGEPV